MSVDARCRATRGAFVIDVELRVADGEMCVLVGPNAAGKTTLLRALAGLLPIDDGSIRINDDVVDDPARHVFVPPERRSVGVVFQDYLLFPHLSALDNVAFGLRERGRRKAAARARAADLLDQVGLDEQRDARPDALSGGQAQRVALARALATEPALLLMDEPFAALDVQHRAGVRRDLRRALASFAGARVLVTHDPVDALSLADRLYILQDGRIVQEGTPDEVIARPQSQYVADLIGVNLFWGDARGDVIHLDNGEVLAIADDHHGAVIATVSPRAVVLHRERPDGSARNVWPGIVDGIERFGDRARIHVTGAVPIVSEVTPNAIDALQLAPGVDVWAAVKATEIVVAPA